MRLDADWSRVRLVQAPGDEPRFGNQDTDGSRSLRHFIQPMRQCGAAMRTMLETAAAAAWGVDVARVRARLHAVHLLDGTGPDGRETGRRLGYGELARAAMALPVPPADKLRYKTDAQFRYMGKGETPIYDLYDITVGRAQYGADVRLEGMKYAVVARPPVVGGKLRKVDSSDALKVPGVERVVEIPGSMPPAKFAPLGGVAVVARSTWAAIQGREKLRIEWDDGPHGSYDTAAFKAEMLKTAASPGKVLRTTGQPDRAFADAARVIKADYYQPHMSHAPMEPPVAVASVKDGRCEIWGPMQSPYGTREDVAAALKLGPERSRST